MGGEVKLVLLGGGGSGLECEEFVGGSEEEDAGASGEDTSEKYTKD